MNRRVYLPKRSESPDLVEMGTQKQIEDGLGAEMSIGRHFRVRPLKRFEAAKAANQGGTAVNFIALGFS